MTKAVEPTFSAEDTSSIAVAWTAFGFYVFLWCFTWFGFLYVFSIRKFTMTKWIIRYGMPWLSPKVLALFVQQLGLAVRATWILLTIFNGPLETQYVFVNLGFILMVSHISMVLCFWADSLLYFVKKQYGMRRNEGFFEYKITRWVCISINGGIYLIQLTFFIIFFSVFYTTDTEEEHPALIYKINLAFFSGVLMLLLMSFLIFAFLIWRFIVTSGGKGNLLGYLFKVTSLLLLLGVVETVKLGFLIYKLTIPGYGSGPVPTPLYLVLVFYLPDLLPTFIFTALEFLTRRKSVLKSIQRMEARYTKYTPSGGRKTGATTGSSPGHTGFEELGEPLMREESESINDL